MVCDFNILFVENKYISDLILHKNYISLENKKNKIDDIVLCNLVSNYKHYLIDINRTTLTKSKILLEKKLFKKYIDFFTAFIEENNNKVIQIFNEILLYNAIYFNKVLKHSIEKTFNILENTIKKYQIVKHVIQSNFYITYLLNLEKKIDYEDYICFICNDKIVSLKYLCCNKGICIRCYWIIKKKCPFCNQTFPSTTTFYNYSLKDIKIIDLFYEKNVFCYKS